MKNISKHLIKGNNNFGGKVITLVSGSALAQILSISLAPITYRIYSATNYGYLGFFMASVAILSSFNSLNYGQSILLVKSDDRAKFIFHNLIWLNLFFSILVSILGIIFYFLELIDGIMIFILPVSILTIGRNDLFRIYSNRMEKYSIMSKATVLFSIITPLISILFGLLRWLNYGLIISLLLSQFIVYLFYLKKIFGFKRILIDFDRRFFKRLLMTYKSLPILGLPSELLNRIISSLPLYFLTFYYSIETVGFYNLSQRLISLPSTIITNSISEVYRKKLSYNETNNIDSRSSFIKLSKLLIIFSVVGFISIYLFGDWFFFNVFGSEWLPSSKIAKIIAIGLFAQMVVSPLTYVYFTKNKLKENFVLHILYLLIIIVSFVISNLIFNDMFWSLLSFSLGSLLIYIIYYIRSYQLLSEKQKA